MKNNGYMYQFKSNYNKILNEFTSEHGVIVHIHIGRGMNIFGLLKAAKNLELGVQGVTRVFAREVGGWAWLNAHNFVRGRGIEKSENLLPNFWSGKLPKKHFVWGSAGGTDPPTDPPCYPVFLLRS